MPVMLALREAEAGNGEFEARLGYIIRSCLKAKKQIPVPFPILLLLLLRNTMYFL
jgi:hypothetical protein